MLQHAEAAAGGHSPGKPGKVGEFQSGQGKVRENEKSQGKLKSVS